MDRLWLRRNTRLGEWRWGQGWRFERLRGGTLWVVYAHRLLLLVQCYGPEWLLIASHGARQR